MPDCFPSPDAALGAGDAAARRSLPVKLRALASGKINKRPVFRAPDEFLPNGILQNIIGLLPMDFVVPQAVFKEVPLPADAKFLRRPFLLFTDNRL